MEHTLWESFGLTMISDSEAICLSHQTKRTQLLDLRKKTPYGLPATFWSVAKPASIFSSMLNSLDQIRKGVCGCLCSSHLELHSMPQSVLRQDSDALFQAQYVYGYEQRRPLSRSRRWRRALFSGCCLMNFWPIPMLACWGRRVFCPCWFHTQRRGLSSLEIV